MKLGVTASRHGLTTPQKERANQFLINNVSHISELHHGDCVKGDEWFHNWIRSYNLRPTYRHIKLHIHPPVDDKLRARCFDETGTIYLPLPYLARNAEIVARCDGLIACPSSMSPSPHSGTWWTYNLALARGLSTYLILPNGDVRHD
jgi:hypothetical protein